MKKECTIPKKIRYHEFVFDYLFKHHVCMWYDKKENIYYAAPFNYYANVHLGKPYDESKECAIDDMETVLRSAINSICKTFDHTTARIQAINFINRININERG